MKLTQMQIETLWLISQPDSYPFPNRNTVKALIKRGLLEIRKIKR